MKSKQNILIINQYPLSFFKDILDELKEDSNLTLICGEKNNSLPNKIEYIISTRYKRESIKKRLFTWISFSIKASFYVMYNLQRFDKLIIVSNPPFALFISLIWPKKLNLLLFDIYPNIIYQVINNKSKLIFYPLKFFIYLWKIVNYFVYKKANKIITISESMAKQIVESSIYPVKDLSQINVIYPWSTLKLVEDKLEIKEFRKKFIKDKRLLIIYSGNMGLSHPLEYLIESSEKITDFAKIILSGNGSKKNKLKKYASKIKKNPPEFLDFISNTKFPIFLSCADLCVVSLDGYSSEMSLPSKLFSIFNCAKPILAICPYKSELSRLVLKYNCGFVIEPNKDFSNNLLNLLRRLYDNPKLLKIASNNSSNAAKDFSVKNALLFKKVFLEN